MRAAVSVVLAGLLVTTPLKQVLAQAAQQDSTDAETSLVREQGSQPVIRVPALTPETALLWQPLAENRARENQVGGYVRVWAHGKSSRGVRPWYNHSLQTALGGRIHPLGSRQGGGRDARRSKGYAREQGLGG